MTITETDKAWVAGALDFRGNFAWQKDHYSGLLHTKLQVCSTNAAFISAFYALVSPKHGPRAQEGNRSYKRKACEQHCPKRHVHVVKFRPSFVGSLTGARAIIITHTVLPYMRARQVEAQEWIEKGIGNILAKSGALSSVCREMSKDGWLIPEGLHYAKEPHRDTIRREAIRAGLDMPDDRGRAMKPWGDLSLEVQKRYIRLGKGEAEHEAERLRRGRTIKS
jgi:hypothetical protein